MNENSRAAFVLEIYDQSIDDLSREKKRLEFRLRLLQPGKVEIGRLTYLFGLISLLFTLYGIVMYLFPLGFNVEMSNSGLYSFLIFAPALSFTVYRIRKKRNNNTIDRIASRIYEIEREIEAQKEKEDRLNMKTK
jgi:hypothetical protein